MNELQFRDPKLAHREGSGSELDVTLDPDPGEPGPIPTIDGSDDAAAPRQEIRIGALPRDGNRSFGHDHDAKAKSLNRSVYNISGIKRSSLRPGGGR